MPTPSNKPKHIPGNSQETLKKLHTQHNFDELLPKCIRYEICPKRRRKPEDTLHAETAEYEEGIKYLDPTTQQPVAVIFLYTDIEGREWPTIRMLRIGDLIYDAKVRLLP